MHTVVALPAAGQAADLWEEIQRLTATIRQRDRTIAELQARLAMYDLAAENREDLEAEVDALAGRLAQHEATAEAGG